MMASVSLLLVSFGASSSVSIGASGGVATERAARVLRDARDAHARRGAFSVVSHNILAPVYAVPGAFGLPGDVLAWPRRRERLCEQLAACDADIVMLQEVQLSTFMPDFDELCAACGYEVALQDDEAKRPYANAILYRAARYELVVQESRSRALIVVLRERARAEPVAPAGAAAAERRLLYLANVHLTKGSSEQLTRLMQLRSLFRRLALHRDEQRALHARAARAAAAANWSRTSAPREKTGDPLTAPLFESGVVAGDFNSARKSTVYELMRDAGLTRFPATTRRPGGAPAGSVRAFRTGFFAMRDVYQTVRPRWGPFEMSHATRALLDYMWASADLDVLETMPRCYERAHAARFAEPTAPRGRDERPPQTSACADDERGEANARAAQPRLVLPSADGAYASDHLPTGCTLAPRVR